MPSRQRAGRGGARDQAIAAANANGTRRSGQNPDSKTSSSSVMSKIDKTGLYDLQQVKRVLDDQVIDVSALLRTPACRVASADVASRAVV